MNYGSITNNRRKFTYLDDNLLLVGLREYGYKEMDLIKKQYLPSKTTNEIKHRYKNLTCAKADMNITVSYTHLTLPTILRV